jgi:hypothetical protein
LVSVVVVVGIEYVEFVGDVGVEDVGVEDVGVDCLLKYFLLALKY